MSKSLKLRQLLVAPQGSWKWQKRLRWVEYTPVFRKDGRLMWGHPEEGIHVSGGNLRSKLCSTGEKSRYRKMLTPCELWASAVPVTIENS